VQLQIHLELAEDLASQLFLDLTHQDTNAFSTRLANMARERFPRGRVKRPKSQREDQLKEEDPQWQNPLPSKVLRKGNFSVLAAFRLFRPSAPYAP
jgi:hypothetical protein